MRVLRWTTNTEVDFLDIKNLVHFLCNSQLLKERIYHVHTGAHCKNGAIGTAQPAFSIFDMQSIVDSSLKAGVYQINNQNSAPRYEWVVDYIDAMCHSNLYQPEIPTAKIMRIEHLSREGQNTLFKLNKKRSMILSSPYLSKETKDWQEEVYWLQDNNALLYCRKDFKHHLFGWGVYEGQCDQQGIIMGEGRFVCTDTKKDGGHWNRNVQEGCWKAGYPQGYSKDYKLTCLTCIYFSHLIYP